MFGLRKSGRGEDVDDAFGRHGAGDDPAHRVVEFFLRPGLGGSAFGEDGLHGLKEADVVADARGLVARHSEGKGLRQVAHGGDKAVLAVLLGEDVLLRRRQESQPFGRRAGGPCAEVEAVQHAEAYLVFLQHERDRFPLVHGGSAGAAAFGVGGQRLLEFCGTGRDSPRPDRRACRGTRGLRERSPASGRGRAIGCPRTWCAGSAHRKPVSPHVAHQYDSNESPESRKRFARASRRGLLRMCRCHSAGSEAEPVMTILIRPPASSSSCQSGRRRTSSS